MTEGQQRRKIPLIFYRLRPGSEPVREWLKGLPEAERHAIGQDLLRAQWRWPVGMPLCRHWETGCGRSGRTSRRAGRHVCCSAFTRSTSSRSARVYQENAHDAG